MAPPGADTHTPVSPSVVGPRDDHVYCMAGTSRGNAYPASMIAFEAYAPTLMSAEVEAAGAPPVERPGPLLDAEPTKMTLCSRTASRRAAVMMLGGGGGCKKERDGVYVRACVCVV